MKVILSAGIGALGMIALTGLVSEGQATTGEAPAAALAQDTPAVSYTHLTLPTKRIV